jgi:ribosomal protein L5
MHGKKIILKMCLETHVADETKTTTMLFLLEQLSGSKVMTI